MSSVAESIQPKSGLASASTNRGTTTTTASLRETASAVSVVARQTALGHHRPEVLREVGLAGKGFVPGVDRLDHDRG